MNRQKTRILCAIIGLLVSIVPVYCAASENAGQEALKQIAEAGAQGAAEGLIIAIVLGVGGFFYRRNKKKKAKEMQALEEKLYREAEQEPETRSEEILNRMHASSSDDLRKK